MSRILRARFNASHAELSRTAPGYIINETHGMRASGVFVICHHIRDSRQILTSAAGWAASRIFPYVLCWSYNEIAVGTRGVHMACSNLDYRKLL